ncbi:hypothetical protein [Swingsia samuiensis]|uniref:Uracil-DNA glycosylase-like domain-containing protein n=1 Tax=Swingsia samuiensis TaxID=1293412 RepID=A0A4Y6UPZ1_9PROT|nr:hypothetical protein [Swingsia samuiensis]QDH18095.1 hypothetical protein E3D00_10365 [Swingsia samuiensis]
MRLDDYRFGGPGNIGTPDKPSIWLCGIEFGEAQNINSNLAEEEGYSVEKQWGWGYNRKAHKLLCCIEGYPISEAFKFAKERSIFASPDCNYMLTNLFPENCLTVDTWSAEAQERTGFARKIDYINHVRNVCFKTMRTQVKTHKPKLFIGVGVAHERDFVNIVSEPEIKCELTEFKVGRYTKRIRLYRGETPLVVIPHLSSASGLNSNESIEKSGKIIREWLL